MLEKLYSSYRKWQKENLSRKDGIIIASDITQEWLLPWWWDHYSRHNKLPVAFVDFGMSEDMKKWCKERGMLIKLAVADIFVTDKDSVPDSTVQKWENFHGKKFWDNRNAWFKKPLACLQSPFSRSIWTDLDCEIRGPLDHLFTLCETPAGLSIAIEQNDPIYPSTKVTYNSGVVIFKHGVDVFEKWADESLDNNLNYAGDQDVLTKLIHDLNIPINVLCNLYNWSRIHKEPEGVIIYHLHGHHGKSIISAALTKKRLQSLGLLE